MLRHWEEQKVVNVKKYPKYMGRPKEDRGYLQGLLVLISLSPFCPSLVIRRFLCSSYRESIFQCTWEFHLLLGGKGEVRVPFLHVLVFKCL